VNVRCAQDDKGRGIGRAIAAEGSQSFLLLCEPIDDSGFEFLWGAADATAMVCVGNFPQNDCWISRSDLAGMAHGNVVIDLSVDQERTGTLV
jgi:hypothetical protein